MKTISYLMFFLFITGTVNAQVVLKGRVTDNEGIFLPGANISIRETYDGASTDTSGYFSFRTTETGKQVFIVSFVGYKTIEKENGVSTPVEPVEIVLTPQAGVNIPTLGPPANTGGEVYPIGDCALLSSID